MIYQLRQRFIAIAVFSLLFVLLTIMVLINLWNYSNTVENANDTLTLIANNNGYFPRPPKDHLSNRETLEKDKHFRPESAIGGKFDQSPEAPFSTRYFSVQLDSNYNALSVNTGSIAAITTKVATEMAEQVAVSGHSFGFQGIYRYIVSQEEDRIQVVFLDCRRELTTVWDFFLNSLWVVCAGLAAVSILIWIFSKGAVRPVAESYEKQKCFITDAGHELKTPLAIINANVEVLELEAGESQWTQSIRNQVERMAKLTAHLTLLASMEEDGRKLPMESLELSSLMEEAVIGMNPLAISHEKTICSEILPGITMQGNRESLQQLITILIDNAIKYSTQKGEIRVTLTKQGKSATLLVSNTAKGISPGKQEQVFERFYRADTSRSRETGGHGLGLSIAKAIVLAHKGKITAECLDGENFVITIKLYLEKT